MAFVNNSWILAGITSFGYGCGKAGYLGIYTRVSSFVTFINSTINLPVSEDTTITVTTQLNSNQPSSRGNVVRDKSILMLMFCFSFLLFFLFSY
jgi:secreted trypsin-like serine protease